jgi:NAD+ synthase
MATAALTRDVFRFDPFAETARIAENLRAIIGSQLKRRGAVVALSGGVDSSVCAALAVHAVGSSKVFGLLLPERESSPDGTARGRRVAEHLGIRHALHDLTPVLEAIGCYRERDDAIRRMFPEYREHWRNKLAIAGGISGQFNYFKLVVEAPDGRRFEARLPHSEYLQIVAAQNYKQRIRKSVEYYHADRLNYAVIGTPNRLEYDQGFFVKNGDGAADVKPIAHLYKTQVYTLARHLGLPEDVCEARPTTDTYSLPQGQDEFFFALPYQEMDLALWAYDHHLPSAALAEALGTEPDRADRVYRDIEAKRRAAAYLIAPPALIPTISPVAIPAALGGAHIGEPGQ